MTSTWLSESPRADVRVFRAAWLMALFSGLVQKPRVAMAWDVLVTLQAMRDLHSLKAAPVVTGITLILLRQVYAQKAQELVGTLACRLARSKLCWSRESLRDLLAGLQDMHNEDSMKLKGRMPKFTGPSWVRLFVDSGRHFEALARAGRTLGDIMAAPAGAGEKTMGELCEYLHRQGKLPLVSNYGIAGILRALSCVLVDIGRPPLALTEADWRRHIRDMTLDTTAVAFRSAGIIALADAERMIESLKASMRRYWGFRKAAEWSAMNVLDLSCQACEFMQVLRALQTSSHRIHGHGAAARWLLQHLPDDAAGIRAMSKSLHLRREKLTGRGNGRDLQSGAAIATDWIRHSPALIASDGRGAKTSPSTSVIALLEQWLPQTRCAHCGSALRPPFRTCAACQRNKRAAYDVARNRKRCYRDGKRTRQSTAKKRRTS